MDTFPDIGPGFVSEARISVTGPQIVADDSTIDAYLPFLDAQWTGGCRKGAELWRRLKGQGFQVSLRVVSEWATRRRRAHKVSNQQLQKVPSARTIARLMTVKRDHMNKADTVTVAAIQAGVPSLVEAHALIERFHAMIRKKEADQLDPWIAKASGSLVSSFATGVARDKAAVRAAIVEPWSNGQVEAQITKLKLVNARCTAARNSTFFKPDCSALHETRKPSSRLRQSQLVVPIHIRRLLRLTRGAPARSLMRNDGTASFVGRQFAELLLLAFFRFRQSGDIDRRADRRRFGRLAGGCLHRVGLGRLGSCCRPLARRLWLWRAGGCWRRRHLSDGGGRRNVWFPRASCGGGWGRRG